MYLIPQSSRSSELSIVERELGNMAIISSDCEISVVLDVSTHGTERMKREREVEKEQH